MVIALLDTVKLTVPDVPGSRSLNSVASVTVKGNALYVDVWDHDVSVVAVAIIENPENHIELMTDTYLSRSRNTWSRRYIRPICPECPHNESTTRPYEYLSHRTSSLSRRGTLG